MEIQMAFIVPLTVLAAMLLVKYCRIDLLFGGKNVTIFKLSDGRYLCRLNLHIMCISSENTPVISLRAPGIRLPIDNQGLTEKVKHPGIRGGMEISLPSDAASSWCMSVPKVLEPIERGLISVIYVVRKRPKGKIRARVVTSFRTFCPKLDVIEIKDPSSIEW